MAASWQNDVTWERIENEIEFRYDHRGFVNSGLEDFAL